MYVYVHVHVYVYVYVYVYVCVCIGTSETVLICFFLSSRGPSSNQYV